MKQYIRTTILLGVIFILAMVVFSVITIYFEDSSEVSSEDVIILNDVSEVARENWSSLQTLDSVSPDTPYVILGKENEMLYRSKSAQDKRLEKISVERAIKKKLPYKYIESDGQIVGSVILVDGTNKHISKTRRWLLLGFGICGVLFLVGMSLFGLYVNKRIIKPFDEMQDFAGKVAEGNLDEPLRMDKGNMFGAFTESFDIMRTELADSRKRELELQRKEKELVASLSHDLKTPITGIKLTSELLKAKIEMEDTAQDGKKDIVEKLDNIYKKADQIDVLVTDLFSTTLEDLGEFKVSCQDEESLILSEIIKKNDSKGLVVESALPKVLINIDAKRMNQVIGNIIVNSYKYAGTKIEADYKVVDKYLEMTLRDFGPGTSKEELDLLTNKFYRGKNVEQKEGSGLGLYIAKSLMVKMNGELICDSDESGFSVKLLIPLS